MSQIYDFNNHFRNRIKIAFFSLVGSTHQCNMAFFSGKFYYNHTSWNGLQLDKLGNFFGLLRFTLSCCSSLNAASVFWFN